MATRHAIVVGGSMGGLVAARALADYYERVTIVDRDTFPAIGEHRKGVPQSRHTHGLLASGRRMLEKFFPGIGAELMAAGAIAGDILADSRWIFEGGTHCRPKSGFEGLLLSRPLLEGMVRKYLFALPNIAVMENCDAAGLVFVGGKVTGLRLASGDTVAADLVVSCAGRAGHVADWLAELGYQAAEVERVEMALGYTTRLFRRHATDLNGDMAIILPSTPEGKRGGVMLAQEDDRWTVTLMSYFGVNAPSDLPGFLEYAKSLPAPDIYDAIRNAEPVSDPQVAKFPASVRHRYEKLSHFPEGFLVFGDAICSFNPIYGQGMSVAALEAEVLSECLASGTANLARRFFTAAAKVIDTPWSIAVGNDLRMPETTGPRNAGVSFINWYMGKLHKAAHHDPVPALAFHAVANLLAAPPSVMHPRVAWRVLLGNLRGAREKQAPVLSSVG